MNTVIQQNWLHSDGFNSSQIKQNLVKTEENSGFSLSRDTSELAEVDSLVRFLHVGAIRSLSTVVSLDGEGVFLLQLAVQLVFSPDDPLTSGLVQDHCLKGDILPVDPEAANLTWTRQRAKRGIFLRLTDDRGENFMVQMKNYVNNKTKTSRKKEKERSATGFGCQGVVDWGGWCLWRKPKSTVIWVSTWGGWERVWDI